MKTKKYKGIGFALLLTVLLAGASACNPDKGNYNYVPVTELKLVNIGDQLKETGEMLQITPEFTPSEVEEGLFTFTWYYRINNSDPWTKLQDGRNLNIKVASPIGTPNQTYRMAFEAKNNETGIAYRSLFNFTVKSAIAMGFMALCQTTDGFDIDMIVKSAMDTFFLHKNLLASVDSKLDRNAVPWDILSFADPMAPNPFRTFPSATQYAVIILTNKYTTHINPADYSWEDYYDIENMVQSNSTLDNTYTKAGKKVIAQKMKYAYTNQNSTTAVRTHMLLDDGNWYLTSRRAMWLLYSEPMSYLRPTTKEGVRVDTTYYVAAPFMSAGGSGAYYFNTTKNRFEYQALVNSPSDMDRSNNYLYTTPVAAESQQAVTKYRFSEMAEASDGVLYMGERICGYGVVQNSYEGYTILKMKDGTYNYLEYSYSSTPQNDAVKTRLYTFPAGDPIKDYKFIASAPYRTADGAGSYWLYFVTQNDKLYVVDLSTSGGVASKEITSQVVSDDGYNEITLFKPPVARTTDMNNIGYGTREIIAVGTYNSAKGLNEGGRLQFFNVNTDNGSLIPSKYPNVPPFNSATHTKVPGYQIDMKWPQPGEPGLGKIVGITYKQQ